MAGKHSEIKQDWEKEFLNIFKQLDRGQNDWQVWSDLMTVIACSISNAIDRAPEHFEKREKEYETCMKRLGSVELPAKIMSIIVMAYEIEPEQDFLGKMYMNLNLGSHWHGQFFTPYNVCRLSAELSLGDDIQAKVKRKGYISVCDCCVGAGAMLIAAANAIRRAEVNFQTNAVFVGQDIDRVVAMMAYIQLSIIGCPGYITVGNTLTNPQTGHVLFPYESEGQELWITPMFAADIWNKRRLWHSVDLMCRRADEEKTVKKEDFFVFF